MVRIHPFLLSHIAFFPNQCFLSVLLAAPFLSWRWTDTTHTPHRLCWRRRPQNVKVGKMLAPLTGKNMLFPRCWEVIYITERACLIRCQMTTQHLGFGTAEPEKTCGYTSFCPSDWIANDLCVFGKVSVGGWRGPLARFGVHRSSNIMKFSMYYRRKYICMYGY